MVFQNVKGNTSAHQVASVWLEVCRPASHACREFAGLHQYSEFLPECQGAAPKGAPACRVELSASFARAEKVAGVHQFSEFLPRQNFPSIVVKLPKRILDKMSIEDRVCHRTMTVQRLQKNCEGRVCHRTMIVTNCTKKLRA